MTIALALADKGISLTNVHGISHTGHVWLNRHHNETSAMSACNFLSRLAVFNGQLQDVYVRYLIEKTDCNVQLDEIMRRSIMQKTEFKVESIR